MSTIRVQSCDVRFSREGRYTPPLFLLHPCMYSVVSVLKDNSRETEDKVSWRIYPGFEDKKRCRKSGTLFPVMCYRDTDILVKIDRGPRRLTIIGGHCREGTYHEGVRKSSSVSFWGVNRVSHSQIFMYYLPLSTTSPKNGSFQMIDSVLRRQSCK